MLKFNIAVIIVGSAVLTAGAALAYTLSDAGGSDVASRSDSVHNSQFVSNRPSPVAAYEQSVKRIAVAPVVVAATHPRPVSVAPVATALSDVDCSQWRPLEQGGKEQQVRSCE